MECNKDEAIRAKEIAEKKFAAKDIMGAKKFAQKAQNLYPGLHDVSKMLTMLGVYIAAEKKVDGEADWYGILGVNPQADYETLRKQYRMFARLFHPDKNKSDGAEGAFKIILEAWIFLSDKEKKQAYDQKRSAKNSTSGGGFSLASGANKFHNIARTVHMNARTKKKSTRAGSSLAPSSRKQISNTFWTVCRQCKMQYEYLRMYLNHNLVCPNCTKTFFARETSPPAPSASRATMAQYMSHQHSQWPSKFSVNTQRDNKSTSNAWAAGHSNSESYRTPFLETSGAPCAAQAATIVQQAYEQVKREREVGLWSKSHYSKRPADVPSPTNNNVAKRRKVSAEVQGYRSVGVPTSSETRRNDGTNSAASNKDILKEKARMEIRKNLSDCKFTSTRGAAAKEVLKGCGEAVEKETSGTGGNIYAAQRLGKSFVTDHGVHCKPVFDKLDARMFLETLEAMAVLVAEPDFHDFDKDKVERSFQENQVWAMYDNDDGMPRYYAMIHKVISLSPFKMQFSWLNSKTNHELGPLNWVAYGFLKTCGEFRLQKCAVTGSLASFSHKVNWTKGPKGVIHIYPKVGEVWALYRNWSPDWNELTADEVIHKYDMVEILEDYSEELGVTIVPLVKISGFKTVFRRHLNSGEVKCIPKHEMFRFSHQVPYSFLVDQEAPSALNGCVELDPAATPLEFLQVNADVEEVELADVGEFSKELNINDSTAKDADMNNFENSGKLNKEQKGELEKTPEVNIVEDPQGRN